MDRWKPTELLRDVGLGDLSEFGAFGAVAPHEHGRANDVIVSVRVGPAPRVLRIANGSSHLGR